MGSVNKQNKEANLRISYLIKMIRLSRGLGRHRTTRPRLDRVRLFITKKMSEQNKKAEAAVSC